jgi:hypothetical protein
MWRSCQGFPLCLILDCDNYWQGSHDYRLEAVRLLDLAQEKYQQVIKKARGGDLQLKADLLRRCGDFQRAMAAVEAGLASKPRRLLKEMLEFEKHLIEINDKDRHSLYELNGHKA